MVNLCSYALQENYIIMSSQLYCSRGRHNAFRSEFNTSRNGAPYKTCRSCLYNYSNCEVQNTTTRSLRSRMVTQQGIQPVLSAYAKIRLANWLLYSQVLLLRTNPVCSHLLNSKKIQYPNWLLYSRLPLNSQYSYPLIYQYVSIFYI